MTTGARESMGTKKLHSGGATRRPCTGIRVILVFALSSPARPETTRVIAYVEQYNSTLFSEGNQRDQHSYVGTMVT